MMNPLSFARALAAGSCLLLLTPAGRAAPPAVTSFFPAGAQQGKTVDVTANGTFERWPAQAHVEGKGVTVRVGKEKGKLSFQVAQDAAPGTYWVRLYDEKGASSPRPFLVGTLPEVLEQEPNDDYHKPHAVPSPSVVNGRLEKAGDVDCFAVKLIKGQTLVASLEAQHLLRSPMDAILQVVA